MTKNSRQNFLKNKRCARCGCNARLTVDHIVSKFFGYSVVNNKQPLCVRCNSDKGILPIDFTTKTFIVQPFMFSLNRKGLNHFLQRPNSFQHFLAQPNMKERLVKEFMK